MKKVIILFCFQLISLISYSQLNYEYDGDGNRNKRAPAGPLASCQVIFSEDYLFLDQMGTGKPLDVSSDLYGLFGDPILESKPDWVTISGFYPYIVSAQPNLSNDIRSGTISFSCDGSGGSITVYQAGASQYINLMGTATPFEYNSVQSYNYQNIVVESNVYWTVSSDKSWLKVDTTMIYVGENGNTKKGISFYTNAVNLDTLSRTAIITLKNNDNTVVKTLTVIQGPSPTLTVSPLSWAAPNVGLSSIQSVNVQSNTYWSASSSNPWLTLLNTSFNGYSSYLSGNGSGSVQIRALSNPNNVARMATITFNVYGIPNQVFTVTQQPGTPIFSFTPTAYSVPASGNGQEINVTSNAIWSATSAQTWATVEYNTINIGVGKFTVRTAKNTSNASRVATLTVKINQLPAQTLTVTQEAPNLSISPSLLNALANGGTQQFTINSNSSWTITSSQPWLTFNTTSGTGNGLINAITTLNYTNNSRNAIITVSVEGLAPLTITVNQVPINISITPNSVAMPVFGGSQLITITSNVPWTISNSATWLVPSAISGNGNDTFTILANENSTLIARNATIPIIVGDITFQNISISQSAPSLSISPTTISALALGETKAITVNSNTTWTSTSNQTWATLSANSGTSNGTFNIVIAPNPTILVRTAIISVSVPGLPEQTINVTQNAGAPTLSISPISYNALGSAMTKTILVTSNAPWTISSNQSWLTSNISNGNGDDAFILTSTTNPNTSTRTAIATVIVAGLPSQTVTVTQAAGPTLSISPTTWSAAKTGGTRVVAIASNSAWTATSNQTWVTLSASSGTGNSNNTLTASANGTISVRTATVTYFVTGLTPKTVSVSQAAGDPTLVVTPLTWNPTSAANNSTVIVTSNSPWTVTSNKSWLTSSVPSSTGNGTFTMNVSLNSGSSRSGTLTVKVNNQLKKDIVVNQNATGSRISAEIVDVKASDKGDASVFPNPADNLITIKIPEINKLKGALSLKNILGKELYSYQKKDFDASGEIKIDISDLPAGIYLIDYQYIDNRKKVLKLIKK